MLEKISARDVRWLAPRGADSEIDRRLTEINRHQLAVNVGHVQQRDISYRVEFQQFALAESLLRHRARKTAGDGQRRRGCADLEDFPAGSHGVGLMPDPRYAQ